MKKLLILVAVLVFLPKAHASCGPVTITPSTFTLQAGQTQLFTANGGSNCTSNPTWTISACNVSSCGSVSPSNNSATTTYTAPSTYPGSGTAVSVTVTATYPNSSNGSASLTITAIQTNALLPSTTSGTVWTDFLTDVVGNQYVTGVNPFMIWNTIESSTASGSGYISGGYDFTAFDEFLVGSTGSIFPS